MSELLSQLDDIGNLDNLFAGDEAQEIIVGGERTYFGLLRFYQIPVDPFVKGARFTIPGILNYEYDEITKTTILGDGLKEFAGQPTARSKYHRLVFVMSQKTEKGETYQRVRQFKSWTDQCVKCKGKKMIIELTTSEDIDKPSITCPECNGTGKAPNAWREFQWQELKNLPWLNDLLATGQLAIKDHENLNSWIPVQYTEVDTSYTGEWDIKKYLSDFKQFASSKEMEQAAKEFYGEGPSFSAEELPKAWSTYPNEFIPNYDKLAKDGLSHKLIAEKLGLISSNGQPSTTNNGNPVNAQNIMSRLVGVPETLLDWS
jgi:hypothetical protein